MTQMDRTLCFYKPKNRLRPPTPASQFLMIQIYYLECRPLGRTRENGPGPRRAEAMKSSAVDCIQKPQQDDHVTIDEAPWLSHNLGTEGRSAAEKGRRDSQCL